MPLPEPEPGTVIRYSYLWADEQAQGREEGREDRPCAIVVATRRAEGGTTALVVPITRSPQRGPDSVEIPPEVKAKLGLDPGERSWAVCAECNGFEWPGPDLRPVPRKGGWSYGKLPDDLFLRVVRTLRAAAARRRLKVVGRTS